MPNKPHETRVWTFVQKVKDLSSRNGIDPLLVAIGFVYVLLNDLLDALAATFGQGKGQITAIRDLENKP